MKTKAQLAETVLRTRLGLADAVQPLAAEDAQLVEDEYDVLRVDLIHEGLAYWPNTGRSVEEIPEQVFTALSYILAGRVAPAFRVPEPVVVDMDRAPVPATTKGYRDLRRLMSKKTSGESVRFVSY